MSKFFKTIVLGIVAAVAVSTVNAQPVAVTGVSADYTSKYVWRGFNLFGSKGAFQPSVDMALFGESGVGLNVWGSFSAGSGNEALTELDYTLSWGTTVGEDATQVDLGVCGIYYDYPKAASSSDAWEVGVSADMPNLLPLGICLSYYTGFAETVDDGSAQMQYHSVGVGKDIELCENLSLSLSADVNYNNDMFYDGADWTHTTVGASLGGIEFEGVSVTPFVNYQSSLVDSPDIVDVLFGGVSVGYSF